MGIQITIAFHARGRQFAQSRARGYQLNFCLRTFLLFPLSSRHKNREVSDMKNVESWKAWVFIGSLGTIAILINSSRTSPSKPYAIKPYVIYNPQPSANTLTPPAPQAEAHTVPITPPPRKNTPEELAAEQKANVAQYVNPGFPPKSQGVLLAVCVASEADQLNPMVAEALAGRFGSTTTRTLTSLLTEQFVSDGLFDRAFEGSLTGVSRLELTNVLDLLLLGRQTVRYTTNTSLQNVITASMGLELLSMSIAPGSRNQRWKLNANGAGFKPADARAQAEERIIKQIAADTHMVFNQVPHHNQ